MSTPVPPANGKDPKKTDASAATPDGIQTQAGAIHEQGVAATSAGQHLKSGANTGSRGSSVDSATATDDHLEEVVIHEDEIPQIPSTIPTAVMVTAVSILLAVLAFVGYTVARGTTPGADQPSRPDPTGRPVLPVNVGEFAKEPSAATESQFGIDQSVLTSSGVFTSNGQRSYLVVAGRTVADVKDLMDRQIKATAVRQVSDALCGRDSHDLDVCAVRRNKTTVVAAGLRSQEPQEIVGFAHQVLDQTN